MPVFSCEYCGGKIEFEPRMAGESTNCPHCQELILLEIPKPPPPQEFLHVGLVSGKEIKIAAVQLYSEEKIIAVQEKRRRIENLSGGVSTGLSPWGSVGWVLEASAALGVIEGILSAAPDAAAKQLLRELPQDYRAIEESADYFNVNNLAGREYPTPSAWSAEKRTRPYIHNGSPFLKYKDETGVAAILRIDSIIHYRTENKSMNGSTLNQ